MNFLNKIDENYGDLAAVLVLICVVLCVIVLIGAWIAASVTYTWPLAIPFVIVAGAWLHARRIK